MGTNIEVAGIFLDCDGVIAETLDIHVKALEAAIKKFAPRQKKSAPYFEMKEYNINPREEFRHHSSYQLIVRLAGHVYPIIQDDEREGWVQDVHSEKSTQFRQLVESEAKMGHLVPRPGIVRLLEETTTYGIPVGIGSAATYGSVEALLQALKLTQHIANLSCEMRGAAAKPNPQTYISLAAKLEIPPDKLRNCITIEDTVEGLSSAKAAGARCIVTRSEYTGEENLSAADIVVDDLVTGEVIKDDKLNVELLHDIIR